MELKTIGLTKKFGSKTAVDNLNITLTNGVYGLLGANGAGKTTLMRLLCNIQNPTSERILLNEKNIVGLGERYRNLLGYLPQHFGYYPDFSAYDFLRYVSALKGLDEKAARKKSKELLEAVDLSKESKQKIKTFSGGMKQRLGIAQAMLNDPHILILDEPTAGLDPKERVRFRNLISAFSKDRIVILSTHIVSDVEFIAEEIIMMKSGQIITLEIRRRSLLKSTIKCGNVRFRLPMRKNMRLPTTQATCETPAKTRRFYESLEIVRRWKTQ